MFCAKCGSPLPALAVFCSQCGQAGLSGSSQPIGSPTQPAGVLPPGKTSGKALASLITGIFGLLLFPIAVVAIILGHISRSEIRQSNGRLTGDGMATAGLVMGYGAFAIIPFILIIAAIAIPNLLRARMAANESSAVAGIRALNSAELSYQSQYPTVGFTCNLSALGGSGRSAPSPDQAQMIDTGLASGEKHGYRFELRNCANSGTNQKYQVVAFPLVRSQTGKRAFCSDETAVIKVDASGSADDCLASGPPLE
jgi:type II secretory pathway pseudopilin PulG